MRRRRRRRCAGFGSWRGLARSEDGDLYVIELRLRIVARPHSDFALGYFVVVEVKDHFVVIVTIEMPALRSDLQPVPSVLVRRHDALLQADQLPVGHAREREVIARASGGKQVEIFVVNVPENQAARTIETS